MLPNYFSNSYLNMWIPTSSLTEIDQYSLHVKKNQTHNHYSTQQ